MTWSSQLRDLLALPVSGRVGPTAYDTAWVARVPDRDAPERPAFPPTLEWLLEHQHPDGSWGADVEYHHDRLLATMRTVLTLVHWQGRMGKASWSDRIERGVRAIWRHASWLQRDPYEIVGFELLLPTMLEEARGVGLALPFDAFELVRRAWEEKLRRIPSDLIYTPRTSLIYSAEFLGSQLDPRRMRGALDEQGSLGASPSATACYLLQAPEDRAAHAYLERVVERAQGAATAIDPIDVFEPAWLYFNALLIWPDASEFLPAIGPTLDALEAVLLARRGIGATRYLPPDLDDTAMVLRALGWAGKAWSLDVLQRFEEKEHFHCYMYERNPSISAHVHLLEALLSAPPSAERDRMVKKAVAVLERLRTQGMFWFDKWHASPYYTTGHAIIALREEPDLAKGALRWLTKTQRPDGSWGFYGMGTAEETAYCVQALAHHRRSGGRVEDGVLERGVAFLADSVERQTQQYVPLWIAKNLYTPLRVVHATVLSALAMAEQG